MIVKVHILKTLTHLNKLHASCPNQGEAIFYSKLALIELCGWIEKSLDDIARSCASRNLKNSANMDKVEREFIKDNHGFAYDNFRKMIFQIIGLINLEKIEKKLERRGIIGLLKSKLNTLKTERDTAAHTFIIGIMQTYPAPSLDLSEFKIIYNCLKEFETELRKGY